MKLRTTILALASLVIASLTMATLVAADESAPALLAAGRADDAITNLRSKISITPNDGVAYNLLCRAYFSTGDWIAAFRRAKERSRSNPTTAVITCGWAGFTARRPTESFFSRLPRWPAKYAMNSKL